MNAAMIEQVRRFNRTVTQRIGALEDSFLARTRPLGQARVLWEIGPDGSHVRALRARLDLDSGYLSRLLRALEADGLVAVDSDGTDGRVRTARLTDAGRAELAELDRRADGLAGTILGPLNRGQRDRLTAAMAEVERLLTASMVRITPTDERQPAARECLAAYFAELATRFETGFDPGHSRPTGDVLLLLATLHDEAVGCGAVAVRAGGAAEIRRMWVAPAVRGLGLGRRLLAELEAHAAAGGAHTVRLETNRALVEAIGLYRKAGYHEVPAFNNEPYAHHWFAKTLG